MKVIRLTEQDVENLVKKILKEDDGFEWTNEVPPLDVVGDYVKEKYDYVTVDETDSDVLNIWNEDADDGMGGPIGVAVKLADNGYQVGIIYPEDDDEYFTMWEEHIPNTVEGVMDMIDEYIGY